MRVGIVLLVAWLVLADRVAALGAALEELPERQRRVRRARQLRALLLDAGAVRLDLQQRLGRGASRPSIVMPLAFVYAYALTRSRMPFKGLFYAVAMLPLFAPSLLLGDLAHLSVRQPGPAQERLFGGSIYGADRHRHGAGVLLLPACAASSWSRRWRWPTARLYEVADALGTPKSARVLHRDPAGRQVSA